MTDSQYLMQLQNLMVRAIKSTDPVAVRLTLIDLINLLKERANDDAGR